MIGSSTEIYQNLKQTVFEGLRRIQDLASRNKSETAVGAEGQPIGDELAASILNLQSSVEAILN